MANCRAYSGPIDNRQICGHAEEAANRAVKKTFAILGVNIDDPKEVENFRKSLRFTDEIRKAYDVGRFAFVAAFVGAFVASVWAVIRTKWSG